VTPVQSTLYGVSYVAPMAFLNMVLLACAASRKARTIRLLKAADAEQRTGFRWYRDGELADRAAPKTGSDTRARRRAPTRRPK